MMKIKRNSKAERKVEVETDESMIEALEQELAEEGIELFGNGNVDDDYLTLPRDITEENSKELGKYFNAFTQQKMWTRTLVGRVGTTIRELKVSLDEMRYDVYRDLPVKMSVKEKELNFAMHLGAKRTLGELVTYEEKYKLLQDYLQNLEDGIFNISREISRRSSDWNDERREENIGKKRR